MEECEVNHLMQSVAKFQRNILWGTAYVFYGIPSLILGTPPQLKEFLEQLVKEIFIEPFLWWSLRSFFWTNCLGISWRNNGRIFMETTERLLKKKKLLRDFMVELLKEFMELLQQEFQSKLWNDFQKKYRNFWWKELKDLQEEHLKKFMANFRRSLAIF